MKNLLSMSFHSDSGCVKRFDIGEVYFEVNLPPHLKEYKMLADGEFEAGEYFVLEYSTMGWKRPPVYRQPCIMAVNYEDENVPLICYDDLTTDGKRYTVAVKIKSGSYKTLIFTFFISFFISFFITPSIWLL